MIVAIHQPHYLPWLGYFAKMDQADVFVLLDNVQFNKQEWQNRNKIKTSQGWQWLTVPVLQRFPQSIAEVRINQQVRWQHKHWQALCSSYSRAPYFRCYAAGLAEMLAQPWERLVDLNVRLVTVLRDALGLHTPLLLASQLTDDPDPVGRLVAICRAVGATTYLAGPDGKKYMDMTRFTAHGIGVVEQQFRHPVYPQQFGAFLPAMAVVDLLCNLGPASLTRLRQAQQEEPPHDSSGHWGPS